MGAMPHKPPLNYGYYIRLLQGLAATVDKDVSRFTPEEQAAIRRIVNDLTVRLAK